MKSIKKFSTHTVLLTLAIFLVLGFKSLKTKFSNEVQPTAAITPLAQDFVVVYESQNPKTMYCYSPGLALAPNGRLIATMDLGGAGVVDLPGAKYVRSDRNRANQGKLFISEDHGKSWRFQLNFPFMHARPFIAGNSVYVLGHAGDLMIIRSDDWGQTWSKPVWMTQGEEWHQSACNVHYANGCIYLVMEKVVKRGVKAWGVASMAPVLMRGKIDTDLTRIENWTFASELVFMDSVDYRDLDYFGVPFFEMHRYESTFPAPNRGMAPIGWLETNVVQIVDPKHMWYDPRGKTFHLWMRAHTGGTGYAAMCKVVEADDGQMTTMLERVPSGKKFVFVPCPGGQMRFHILYDEKTKMYWLLSSQATDSMTRPGLLPANRYSLPNNERHRLQLHFSKNMIDWCFAGMVAVGGSPKQGRHYASMVIDGEDLHVLSRSGDERAKSAHDGNLITFHTIKNFRALVY